MSILILIFTIVLFFGLLQTLSITLENKTIEAFLIIVLSLFLFLTTYLKLKKMNASKVLFTLLGILLGSLTGLILSVPLFLLSSHLKPIGFAIITGFTFAGGFYGTKQADKHRITDFLTFLKEQSLWEEPKVLDTNILIDGRIADLIEQGFIKGTILIPRFILREIQYIADSPDPLRRAKGKRALEILQRIQRAERVRLEIVEKDIPEIKEVDVKLIEFTRGIKGTLITNDINLIKIAQLRGVEVLNINELAKIMRPPVLPGDNLNLFVVREGKEPDQGVAYLDDGTMIVIEGGKPYLGKTIEVTIHSVLQTGTGRMIFGKPKKDLQNEKESF